MIPTATHNSQPATRYTDLARLAAIPFRLVKPPLRMNLSNFADANIIISKERNPSEYGRWRTDRAPWLRAIMDACTNRQYKSIIVMKAARMGATAVMENLIAYHIAHDPCNMMMVQPTVEDAQGWSKEHFAPMARDNEFLQLVAEAKSRDSANTILHKTYPGGLLKIAGANSPRAFRRMTIRIFIMDEMDANKPTSEGDQWALGTKRTATVWNALALGASTPTVAGISPVEREYADTNQMHYHVPCPHCNEKQILFFSEKSQFRRPGENGIVGELGKGWLKFDKENLTWATYVCGLCGLDIDESSKHAMVAAGEWRAARPEVIGAAGFHISELYSTFNTTWLKIAKEFLKAKREWETLRVFINQTLGETAQHMYGQTITQEELMQRREKYFLEPEKVLPSGILFLCCSVDVQVDRLELLLAGYGTNWETWMLEHKILPGDPSFPKVWKDLDEYLLKRHRTEEGVELGIVCTLIDANYNTDAVFEFTRGKADRNVFAIRGAAGPGNLIPSNPKRNQKRRGLYYELKVDSGKTKIASRLKNKRNPDGSLPYGYVHFNETFDADYFAQLTSEVQRPKIEKGQRILTWVLKKANQRNEGLDITVYNLAAAERLPPNWEKLAVNHQKRIEESHPERSEGSDQSKLPQSDIDNSQSAIQKQRKPPGWDPYKL